MSIKLATHLYRNRHGIFYFRLVIPRDLRDYLQQSEARFSLYTEQRHQAIMSTIPIIADLPKLITDLRRMANDNEMPPSDYLKLWLEEKRKNIDLQTRYEELENQLIDAHRLLKQSVPRTNAQRVVESAFDKGQLKGKRELEEKVLFPWPPEKTKPFSELKAKYLKSLTNNRPERGTKKPPTPKTLEEYDRTLEFFITVMGDLRIGEIDREIAGGYFAILKKLPPNISRVRKYHGMTIDELLVINDPPQSETNCSKKIERISTMFKWALEEKRKWGIDANPFTGFGQADNNETRRRPFTHDELRALLNHPDFIKRQFASSYAFWLIPLATFTGARLTELCQLDLKDFVTIDGVPCIDINDIDAVEINEDGGRKKRVKTKNAKRLVPLHPELIRIGILRYVAALRQRGEQHLFPELNRARRDGPAHAASNWFGRFRAHVGLNAKQETVFHSFRHLFITNILDGGVSPHMLAPIVGHEADLITGQVYWNKKDATKRQPTVEAFTLIDDIRQLFPTIEEVTFIAPRGPRPGRKRTAASATAS